MADEVNVKLVLDTELGNVNKSINTLKDAGAFNSKRGAQDFNKIQGIYDSLKNILLIQ